MRAGGWILIGLLALGAGAAPARATFPGATGLFTDGSYLYEVGASENESAYSPAAGMNPLLSMRFTAAPGKVLFAAAGSTHQCRQNDLEWEFRQDSVYLSSFDGADRAPVAVPAPVTNPCAVETFNNPAPGPDGRIAYLAVVHKPGGSSPSKLHVRDLASGEDVTLGGSFAPSTRLDWAPDGSAIAVSGTPAHLVDTATGVVSQFGSGNLSWAPDGERLVIGKVTGETAATYQVVDRQGQVQDTFTTAPQDNPVVGSVGVFTAEGDRVTYPDCRMSQCGYWSRTVARPGGGSGGDYRLDHKTGGYLPDMVLMPPWPPDWQAIPIAVKIVAGPSGTIGETPAVFDFALVGGDESAGTFECRLLGPQDIAWAPCEAPKSFGVLASGEYLFEVRFVPAGGDPEDSPVQGREFIVDREPPALAITQAPPAETEERSVTIAFTATPPDGVTFRCKLDDEPEHDCSSPKRLSSLGLGAHAFTVGAEDAAGNAATPVTVGWKVVEGAVEPEPAAGPEPTATPGAGPVATPAPGPAPADEQVCGSGGGSVTIGVLTAVAQGACFKSTRVGDRQLNAVTGVPVKVNGVVLTPDPGVAIVVDGRLGDGIVRWTGPVKVAIGSWSFRVGWADEFPVTRAATAAKFGATFLKDLLDELKFGGLELAVEPSFELSDTESGGGTTKIGLKLEFPDVFHGLPGPGGEAAKLGLELSLTVSNRKPPSLAAKGKIAEAYLFGILPVEEITVAVDEGPPLALEGSAKLKLAPVGLGKGLGADAAVELSIAIGEGGVGIGGLRKLAIQASELQKPFVYGLFFQRMGGEFTAESENGRASYALNASMGLSLGPKIAIPYLFEGEAVSLDGKGELKLGDTLTFKHTGEGKIVNVPVAAAEVLWQPAKGRVDFKSNLDLDVNGYGFRGATRNGLFELPADRKPTYFNIEATAELRLGGLVDQLEGMAEAVLSEKGWAACYGDAVRIGLGALWGQAREKFDGFARSCDIGPYRSAGVGATVARAAQAGPPGFDVKPGAGAIALAVTGDTAAPAFQLVEPGGATLLVDPAGASRGRLLIGADPAARTTHVAVLSPRAGRWELRPAPGAASPRSLRVADPLPGVAVEASVRRGRGGRRTLAWRARRIPGQRIAFFERSGDTLAPIATSEGGSGAARFTPAAVGPADRSIVALVSQDGLPRRRLELARFHHAPPALRRVRGIRRTGGRLRWRGQGGASRYFVAITPAGGVAWTEQTARPSLRLPARLRRARLAVRVVALGAGGRVTHPTTARIRARKEKR